MSFSKNNQIHMIFIVLIMFKCVVFHEVDIRIISAWLQLVLSHGKTTKQCWNMSGEVLPKEVPDIFTNHEKYENKV